MLYCSTPIFKIPKRQQHYSACTRTSRFLSHHFVPVRSGSSQGPSLQELEIHSFPMPETRPHLLLRCTSYNFVRSKCHRPSSSLPSSRTVCGKRKICMRSWSCCYERIQVSTFHRMKTRARLRLVVWESCTLRLRKTDSSTT